MFKLARYLKPLRLFAALTLVFSILHSGLSLMLPRLLASIINNGISDGKRGYILIIGSIMLVLSALSADEIGRAHV